MIIRFISLKKRKKLIFIHYFEFKNSGNIGFDFNELNTDDSIILTYIN